MPYFFWNTPAWFAGSLCCRYLVVQFGGLRIAVRNGDGIATEDWTWALGLFTDGRFEVLGAWRADQPAAARQIAHDLNERGIDRIKALAADGALTDAMAGFKPKLCRATVAELAASGAFGPRMRRALRWTEVVAAQVQGRMARVVQRQPPFADGAAAAHFIAQAFQRTDRDLLDDRWDRARPAPCGRSASAAALAQPA